MILSKFVVFKVYLSTGVQPQGDYVSAAQGLVQCQMPLCVN